MEIGMMQFAGLKNDHCVQSIEQVLKAVDGVDNVRMTYDMDNSADVAGASVTFDEALTSLASLRSVVMDFGYQVTKPAHGEDGVCCGGCGG